MKKLLNFLPLVFLAGGLFSAYSFYTAESGLLQLIPVTIAFFCAFFTSIAWLISPQGIAARKISGIAFFLTLIIGAYFCFEPTSARSVWMILCFLVFVGVHSALFAISASSFIFSEGRKLILLLPVLLSVIGVAGLFIWNGKLGICFVGLAAAVILALIATLFGMPGKKAFNPEEN